MLQSLLTETDFHALKDLVKIQTSNIVEKYTQVYDNSCGSLGDNFHRTQQQLVDVTHFVRP